MKLGNGGDLSGCPLETCSDTINSTHTLMAETSHTTSSINIHVGPI